MRCFDKKSAIDLSVVTSIFTFICEFVTYKATTNVFLLPSSLTFSFSFQFPSSSLFPSSFRTRPTGVGYLAEIFGQLKLLPVFLCWYHCLVCRQFTPAGSHRAGSDCHCSFYSWRDITDTLHQAESCR